LLADIGWRREGLKVPKKQRPRGRLWLNDGIYLGHTHVSDGLEGANKRIELARKYVTKFGVATACGFARARKLDLVQRLLAIHAGPHGCHGDEIQ
jgi:hypothetical protein